MKTVHTVEQLILRINQGEQSLRLLMAHPSHSQEIARVLSQNTALTALDLSCNHLDVDGAHTLAEGLAGNTTLIWLGLDKNEIGDKGAQALAEALSKNTGLTSLSLQSNNIGDKGAQALAKALSENVTLTELDLGINIIGVDGGYALADALTKNTTLISLSLQSNKIGYACLQAFAAAVAKNVGLISLNLSSNDFVFHHDFCRTPLAILDSLAKNTTLTSLDLDYRDLCVVRKEDGQRLKDWMARNEKIQGLSMSRAGCKWQEIKTPAIGYVHGGNKSLFFEHSVCPRVMHLALSFAQKP